LASEALRGEGAVLIDENGLRFMQNELDARDIVTRNIWEHMSKGHKVFLDGRKAVGENFPHRFPTIYAYCISAGIDPIKQPIPILPVAHYHMGGVAVDELGRSSISGLYAYGEVAATGLHGANRLASNSLLEAAVFAKRVAKDMVSADILSKPAASNLPAPKDLQTETPEERAAIREIMSEYVGIVRDGLGLEKAMRSLAVLARHSDMALVGLLIATAAHLRKESRGAHYRVDCPHTDPGQANHIIITLDDVIYPNGKYHLS
ncbi:MAG: FAD-binding protein, partial [Alphaproteobacteria bacterium]|nr:FAD-binding protein [Alphaproteobacteria bacterium]